MHCLVSPRQAFHQKLHPCSRAQCRADTGIQFGLRPTGFLCWAIFPNLCCYCFLHWWLQSNSKRRIQNPHDWLTQYESFPVLWVEQNHQPSALNLPWGSIHNTGNGKKGQEISECVFSSRVSSHRTAVWCDVFWDCFWFVLLLYMFYGFMYIYIYVVWLATTYGCDIYIYL